MIGSERLRVQTVLHDHDPASLSRYCRGLGRAITNLREKRQIGVEVALGDCSQVPVLSEERLEVLRSFLERAGARPVCYELFGANLGHGGAQNRLFEGSN